MLVNTLTAFLLPYRRKEHATSTVQGDETTDRARSSGPDSSSTCHRSESRVYVRHRGRDVDRLTDAAGIRASPIRSDAVGVLTVSQHSTETALLVVSIIH